MIEVVQEREGAQAVQAQQALAPDLFARFIAYLDAKPKTVETYTRTLRPFYNYLAGRGIARPTREDILLYRESLRATKKAATVQAYMLAVRLFFRWTAQAGIYPNVADRIKGETPSRDHKKDYLGTRQVADIMGHIDAAGAIGKRDYAVMALMVTAGLRTIEVVRANVEDMRTLGDSAVLYVQGKGRSDRAEYVKLAAPVEQAIRAYLKTRGALDAKEPLFTSASNNSKGGRMTTKSVSRLVKDRLISAGYSSDRLTAHSLRHTAATLNLLNGGTLEETQQLLRHSNINTTMIYLHHIERAKNNSEDRIARAIFGA